MIVQNFGTKFLFRRGECKTRDVRPEKFQFLEKGQNRNFDYKVVNFG